MLHNLSKTTAKCQTNHVHEKKYSKKHSQCTQFKKPTYMFSTTTSEIKKYVKFKNMKERKREKKLCCAK